MIPLDFEYVTPRTLREAVAQFTNFANEGMNPLYFAGGTEIVTLARLNQVSTGAVINIKSIPETQVARMTDAHLYLGSAITLTQLTDNPQMNGAFPLLKATVQEIADRTARNQITLGGNICGQIIYREAVLPMLVCDSEVWIVGPKGVRQSPIRGVFQRTMQLSPGEFVAQFATSQTTRQAPFVHIKRRKMGQVGYPIVTVAAIRVNEEIRVAFSGVSSFPFRSSAIESQLNRQGMGAAGRVEAAVATIPNDTVLDDFEASRDYRLFVLRSLLHEILQQLGG